MDNGLKCDATISGVSGMGGKGTAGGEPLANEDNIDGTSSDGSNIGPDCGESEGCGGSGAMDSMSCPPWNFIISIVGDRDPLLKILAFLM